MYYRTQLDIWVKSYDNLIFSRASVVQFQMSRYIMRLNRTSEWKVMTIGISRELSMFNFECLVILWSWIGHPSKKLWPFAFLHRFRCSISCISICEATESDIRVKGYDHLNFSRASVVPLRTSRYIMRLNWTSKWKVVTIWISRELPLFNYEHLVILCAWIGPSCEKLLPFEYLESFHCSILRVSICDAPKSDMRVKS